MAGLGLWAVNLGSSTSFFSAFYKLVCLGFKDLPGPILPLICKISLEILQELS